MKKACFRKEVSYVCVSNNAYNHKAWVIMRICRINGLTSINLTKLDVLSELETIRLGTAYKLDGQAITAVPATIEALEKVEVIYEDLPGWQEDISKVEQLLLKGDLDTHELDY